MSKYRNYSKDWLYSSKAFGEHVSAMTREKLHSKSDIAAELAWRDDQIAKANERVKELSEALEWSLGCHNFDNREMPEAYGLWEDGYSLLEQLRKEQDQ